MALSVLDAGAAAPVRVVIEMPVFASVSKPHICLGDIVSLTTKDLPLLRRLMAVPLGSAPRGGVPVILGREALTRWLRSQTGLSVQEIEWRGAHSLEIRAATQELDGKRAVSLAADHLKEWLSGRSEHATVEPVAIPANVQLVATDVVLKVRPQTGVRPERRMVVWVDAYTNEKLVRSVPVTFEVHAWKVMPVAARNLEPGAGLTPDALTYRDTDMTAGMVSGAALLPSGSGDASPPTRLRRWIRAGEVLTESSINRDLAVLRGDWVGLRVRSGDIALQSQVEALQDGRVGQWIRVRMHGASASALARVAGPSSVEILQ
ncbi:flagellar basal body P-ring formation chaperone FlgA [Variovorax terrae]|uniref:Flagellar basal body P-ring formation chaperone FlgA n=1 Tax=Variovorax terrae TaxID=2923278 RepID=A0A9X1VYL4_9BURK|nr:flagellar basal body P-ring formation chaperone FlgA [Variovorax terrae]MCJ0764549.1 flagellar basal body P-ring formation chaperone FlgA [Variovorax terrae]